MNQSLNLKQITDIIIAKRGMLIFLLVIALFGYTGFQISRITSVQPDQAYISAQKKSSVSLKGNKATIENLKALRSSGDTSIPINVGKHNPFTF